VAALLAKYPSASVRVVGHSLGSALAVLGAADIAQNFNVKGKLSIVLFGSPRVFNHATAKFVSTMWNELGASPNYRIVNGGDLVPKVPLINMAYVHTGGTEIWFPNGGSGGGSSPNVTEVMVCPNTPGQENLACSNTLSALQATPSDHTWFCAVYPCIDSGC
jgi:hypothetical protein